MVGRQDPILGVVGALQFDVLIYRLKDEYGIDPTLERLSYSMARWPKTKEGKPVEKGVNGNIKIYHDAYENPVILFNEEWDLRWAEKNNPEVDFYITSQI